jgi:hypothetical protein
MLNDLTLLRNDTDSDFGNLGWDTEIAQQI